MNVTLGEFIHEFPVLGVYPRVQYFYRRYKDLLTRYRRITGALPTCFHDETLVAELEHLSGDFANGIKVHVIGHTDIDDDRLVFGSHVSEQQMEQHEPNYKIVVWHISHEIVSTKDSELLKTALKPFVEYTKRFGKNANVFIKCDVNREYSQEEKEKFGTDVLETINEEIHVPDVPAKCISVDCNDIDFMTKISDAIEKDICYGFLQICYSLKTFENYTCSSCLENSNVFETNTVTVPIKTYLRGAHHNVELTLVEDLEEKMCAYILENLIVSLCLLTKCSLVQPLAKKFGLKPWLCNCLLHHIRFEEAMSESITKNTRHHLEEHAAFIYKTRKSGRENNDEKCFDFDFLFYKIRDDLLPIIGKVEMKFRSMQKLSMAMGRMVFEVHGYLKQSYAVDVDQLFLNPVKVSKELRNSLLAIEGVFGLGTVYGKLEIHVENAEVKDTHPSRHSTAKSANACENVDESYNEQPRTNIDKVPVTSVIASTLHKHNFYHRYTIKNVLTKPDPFAANCEPGDKLLLRGPESSVFGTLGGFVLTRNGTIHALTCGHVVGQEKRIFVQKAGFSPLSCCPRIIPIGSGECKYVDIAALELIPLLQRECKPSLESNGRIKAAKVYSGCPEAQTGKLVYKYGSATGETKGFIVSADYIYKAFDEEAKEYLMIIDTLPDVQNRYADEFSPLTDPNSQSQAHADDIAMESSLEKRNSSAKDFSFNAQNEVLPLQDATGDIDIQGIEEERLPRMNEDREDSSLLLVSGPDDECGSKVVYVREFESALQNQSDPETASKEFAERGDSGSIICVPEPTHERLTYSALSMLSAGDFKIAGDETGKCLSFKLDVGLERLQQTFHLDFQNVD